MAPADLRAQPEAPLQELTTGKLKDSLNINTWEVTQNWKRILLARSTCQQMLKAGLPRTVRWAT